MEAIVRREELQVALRAVSRVVGKLGSVFLEVDSDRKVLSIIANSTRYLKYRIAAKNVKKGRISLHTSVFEGLLSLRKKKIELKTEGNALLVQGGTNLKLYCSKLPKDQLQPPEMEKTKSVVVDSKGMAIFRKLLDKVSFKSIGDDSDTIVQITNGRNKLVVALVDDTHCSFYYSKPVSNKKFSFTTYLNMLKDLSPFLENKSKLIISGTLLMVNSSNILATLPALQVGGVRVKNAKEALADSNYKKGSIIFDTKKFEQIFSSVGIVREGADIIELRVDGKKVKLRLETSFGVSTDSFKCSKNTLKRLRLKVPVIMFEDVLGSCSFGEELEFRVGRKEKFYMLSTSDRYYQVKTIAPLSSVD